MEIRIANPSDLIKRWAELMKHETESPDPYDIEFEKGGFTIQYFPEFYLTTVPGYPGQMVALNPEAGWSVKEVKSDTAILNIEYSEELVSKNNGDQTYILAHTLVQSVVIRWVAASQEWLILQAQGDIVTNFGVTIMMAEMLEPLFPFKRASKNEVNRIKFDQYTLRRDQTDILTDFSTVIGDLVKHFEIQLNQLPQTASLEEITDLGNDKKWKTIENIIHARFCSTLRNIFADGYNTGFWFWENYHPWDFIKTTLTTKEGFYSDCAQSTLELEVSTTVAKLDIKNEIPDKNQKMNGLFCEGLMNRNFSSWIKTLVNNKSELERCYSPEALLRSEAMEGVIELLDLLSGLPFSLNYVPAQESR